MKTIITLGEIMLRLSPKEGQRLVQSNNFSAVYGGGEANVAVSLALWGNLSRYVTKLPDNELGQAAINNLRAVGVDTSMIKKGGNRIGIYFCEIGSIMRPSKVVYDRAQSAIAEATCADFDFESIFEGADWFHWTGITPALSESTAEIIKEACIIAKKKGVTISCDLNFRKKLWNSERAQQIMKPLMHYVDVCIGNEEDASLCLGVKSSANVEKGETSAENYKATFKQLQESYGFKFVASTLRESYSASYNGWKALIYNGSNFYESRHYDIWPITDRVGGGDAFAAGLIHKLAQGCQQEEALEFAVAASAMKHTISGDFNCVTEEEVMSLVKGNASGRVQR